MEQAIEEIKSKINIVEFIAQYVTLKKSGRNFKANCPFHNEKTPSFVISADRQIWHCFGSCGEGGDVIAFLMKRENMTFIEAVRELAEKVGVKIDDLTPSGAEDKLKERIISINYAASRYYEYLLTKTKYGEKALEYLRDRGINDKILKTFSIGYSPSSWDSLLGYLKKKKYTDSEIIASGLMVENNGRIYDRFRNRIVFPIKNVRGNVIGFSGRILDKDERGAKYVNTPETMVYHKRESLYGIDLTKDSIRTLENVYIVEGEFDMIFPFQKGIENIVAIKGSALTREQLMIVKRYTNKITLALDTDNAGLEAMKRGINEAEKMDFEISVARFSKGKDPDEAARADFIVFKKELESAVPFYDFLFDTTCEKYPDDSPFHKKKIGEELIPYISTIENLIVQSHYIKKLALYLDVPTESIQKMIYKLKRKFVNKSRFEPAPVEKKGMSREEMMQKYLVSYVLDHSLFVTTIKTVFSIVDPEDIQIPILQKIIQALKEYAENAQGEGDVGVFINSLQPELKPTAEEVSLFASGITELEHENIANIVYEIKEASYRRLYSTYSQKEDEDSIKKARDYKSRRENINKSELEKTLKSL